ncbi:MAG: transketolase [Clostridia bacterium]
MELLVKRQLERIAAKARLLVVEAVYLAQSGHPGGSLSITDILTYLYFEEMNIDPTTPKKPKRDRFVLSKGHTCPALYSVLALKGYFGTEELKKLRKIDGILQGHPDMKKIPGIDMSTGSLGQGISAACGMALSAKLKGENYRIYTALGDGEIQEGEVWEAAMFAAHNKLDNLTVIVDNNNLQIDGNINDVCSPEPINKKFESFGFEVFVINGHNFEEIESAFKKAKNVKGKPVAIISKSTKGKGVTFMENNAGWHGKAPSKEQFEQAKTEIENVLALLTD